METHQRSIESSLVNVQAFLDAHADLFGVLKDSPARVQLDDAIQRVQSNAGAQNAAVLAQSVNRAAASQAALDLVNGHMAPMSRFARASLKGAAGFAALTKRGEAKPSRALVAEAHAMATAATPLVPQLTAAKFPTDVVQQLSTAADQLEAAMASTVSNRATRIAATSGLASALKDGRDAVRMIDPVVTRMLQGSPLLAAWRSVKRVRSAPTPAVAAPTATPTTAAATPAAATPAAATPTPTTPAASTATATPVTTATTSAPEVKAA